MNKKKSNYPKLKFNTDITEITLDGKKINSVIELKIEAKGGEKFSTVTIKFDSNVEVEGTAMILPHYSLESTINAVKEATEGNYTDTKNNYVSERIVNIHEIEALIRETRFLSNNLIDAINNKEYFRAENLSSDINLKLHMLDKFDFIIEQRKIKVTTENNH